MMLQLRENPIHLCFSQESQRHRGLFPKHLFNMVK